MLGAGVAYIRVSAGCLHPHRPVGLGCSLIASPTKGNRVEGRRTHTHEHRTIVGGRGAIHVGGTSLCEMAWATCACRASDGPPLILHRMPVLRCPRPLRRGRPNAGHRPTNRPRGHTDRCPCARALLLIVRDNVPLATRLVDAAPLQVALESVRPAQPHLSC